MPAFRSTALACLSLAASLVLAPVVAHAQMTPTGPTMPEYSTDSKNSSGRDLDNLQDKINGYNSNGPDLYKARSGGMAAMSPADQVAGMGAGVNLFEGDDPYFLSKSSKFSDSDIQRIADAGFKTIRVPLFVFAHLDKQGNPDSYYVRKIDHLVDLATKAHLNIILDEHNYEECATDTSGCYSQLTNVWNVLATHYQNAPANVIFELLNEPNGNLDAATWNSWLPGLVAAVRQDNPDRNIIIGPTMWNSPDQLDTLKLPADDHIIVTFHYYSPMEFTHQGASWAGPQLQALHDVRWTGSPDEVAAIATTFDKVKAWSTANNKPIFLGEFGSYAKVNPNLDDRAAWTRAVSQAAADRGFARALWVYEGSAGFGIHDKDGNKWVEPLKSALLLQ